MNIGSDSNREKFRREIAEFCHTECASKEVRDALTNGGLEVHSTVIAEKMAALGWLGVAIPEAFGGSGGSYADLCCFLEATGYELAPINAFPSSMIAGTAYQKFGSPEQQRDVLGGIAAGRVEALALSEPAAGSDLGALTCRASRADGGYLLDGRKCWSSNAHLAAHILVLARTADDSSGPHGLTMFQVPAGAPGMRIVGVESIAGRQLHDLYFETCRVPESAIVGTLGEGWLQAMATLTVERLVIAAVTLGQARRAFDDALGYVKQRTQFGQPVGRFQALRHRFADLATDLECCRLLVYHTAANGDRRSGRLLPREAAMAKLRVTEVAKRVAVDAMQTMGAHGTLTDNDMPTHLRSALLSTIMGGTSEIQREIIGRSLGL